MMKNLPKSRLVASCELYSVIDSFVRSLYFKDDRTKPLNVDKWNTNNGFFITARGQK
jgi:hypothetical protein